MNYTMKELSVCDRPYEKCLQKGADVLTDAELLAVIIRTGSNGITSVELAREVLNCCKVENSLLGLYHLNVAQLMQIKGIGKVKAVQLKCIAELAKRMAKATAGEGRVFQSAAAIADYYMEDFRHCHQEMVFVLMFNAKCKLLHESVVSKGTVSQSSISPREIFLEALEHHAVYIIVMHNHPSGDAAPSREDIALTQRIAAAGSMLGIELMDHIILGDRCYTSFCELGLLNKGQAGEKLCH